MEKTLAFQRKILDGAKWYKWQSRVLGPSAKQGGKLLQPDDLTQCPPKSRQWVVAFGWGANICQGSAQPSSAVRLDRTMAMWF